MPRKIMYVTPRQTQNGLNWAVLGRNANRPVKICENKTDAVTRAKEIAQNTDLGQIVVQGRNGKFQYENTYGNDPIEYKG